MAKTNLIKHSGVAIALSLRQRGAPELHDAKRASALRRRRHGEIENWAQ